MLCQKIVKIIVKNKKKIKVLIDTLLTVMSFNRTLSIIIQT